MPYLCLKMNWSTATAILTTALLGCVLPRTNAATYQLSYDTMVNPSSAGLVRNLKQEDWNLTVGDLDYVVNTLGEDFIMHWNKYRYAKGAGGEQQVEQADDNLDLEVSCIPREKRTRCFADHAGSHFSFSIDAMVYQLDGEMSDYFMEEQMNAYFPSAGGHHHEDERRRNGAPFGVRFDIVVDANSDAAPRLFARDILIHALDGIRIFTVPIPAPVWSIKERPSLKRVALLENEKEMVSSASAASSLETMVLSNSNAISRKPLFTFSHELYDESMKPETAPWVDIWSIQEVDQYLIWSLFIDGKLRTTTGDAGIAHAEAFVHPALVAHPDPRRVAVISDAPLSLLVEILKHKSIEKVTLVGAHVLALKGLESQLDECYMHYDYHYCLGDDRVEIVEGSVDDWLNSTTDMAEDLLYDVFLVDVGSPSQSKEYLSVDFFEKIQELVAKESIVIFNAGTTPSLDVNFASVNDNLDRTAFLKELTYEDSGYADATLYDEVRYCL